MTVIKADIVRHITQKVTLNEKLSKKSVDCILNTIKSTLESDQEVVISGFGNFNLRSKKPRVGRNPKTKEEFLISARKVVTFAPSKVFRKEINS